MVDFYGKLVGKYTSSYGSYGYGQSLPFRCFLVQVLAKSIKSMRDLPLILMRFSVAVASKTVLWLLLRCDLLNCNKLETYYFSFRSCCCCCCCCCCWFLIISDRSNLVTIFLLHGLFLIFLPMLRQQWFSTKTYNRTLVFCCCVLICVNTETSAWENMRRVS